MRKKLRIIESYPQDDPGPQRVLGAHQSLQSHKISPDPEPRNKHKPHLNIFWESLSITYFGSL